jgi:T-complex protein 1 subunit beta
MAAAIDKRWKRRREKKALAKAALLHVRCVPAIVADNGGYDSAELVARLQAAHAAGNKVLQCDVIQWNIGDMLKEMGVESFEKQASRANEVPQSSRDDPDEKRRTKTHKEHH